MSAKRRYQVCTRRMATNSNLCSRLSVGQNEWKQIEVQQKQNKKGGKGQRRKGGLCLSPCSFFVHVFFPLVQSN